MERMIDNMDINVLVRMSRRDSHWRQQNYL